MTEKHFFLGNFRVDNTIQNDVELAAKETKRDIRFLDTPMPIINPKVTPEDRFTVGFGCIAVYDGKRDCSKFWAEFKRIRKVNKSENSA